MSESHDNPVQNVSFPSNGSHAHGYLALPPTGHGPGLIVIQEWWGLTTHIAHLTDRFSAAGFVALAPDLYGGATTHDAEEAGRLMQELPAQRAVQDLKGAVDFLAGHEAVDGKVGAVGFCMGGAFVLQLGAAEGDRLDAVVAFYSTPQEDPDFTGFTAPFQGHYAEGDGFHPKESVERIVDAVAEASGQTPEIHWYPAGHAFMNDENLIGTYDADQAAIAWDRAVTFLHEHLG